MELLRIIPNPYDDILVILLLAVGVYFAWKVGKNKQNTEAVDNYKSVTESQEARIKVLEDDFKRAQTDKHELTAQVNQLIGENKALKDLLTYQDPAFKKTIEAMLGAIKQTAEFQSSLHQEFVEHSKEDDKRFAGLHETQIQIRDAVKSLKKGK
jgi:predicted negative regulator of RcsB-dependent stress response